MQRASPQTPLKWLATGFIVRAKKALTIFCAISSHECVKENAVMRPKAFRYSAPSKWFLDCRLERRFGARIDEDAAVAEALTRPRVTRHDKGLPASTASIAVFDDASEIDGIMTVYAVFSRLVLGGRSERVSSSISGCRALPRQKRGRANHNFERIYATRAHKYLSSGCASVCERRGVKFSRMPARSSGNPYSFSIHQTEIEN